MPISLKIRKRDTTVDDKSHLSKMKSRPGKYDKIDINGRRMYSVENKQPCRGSSSDTLLIFWGEGGHREEHGEALTLIFSSLNYSTCATDFAEKEGLLLT